MKKQVIGFLMAVCLIMGLLPAITPSAQAALSGTCGDHLTWTLNDKGTLTISGTGAMKNYDNNSDTYDIPWYNKNSSVKQVVIKDGVTSIGDLAFYDCENLSSVKIPDSVTRIGHWVFAYCDSLSSVTIPQGVTRVGKYAFYNCENLKSITIANSVTSIGDFTFCGCEKLKSVSIKGDAPAVDSYTFYGCPSSLVVSVPKGATGYNKAPWKNYTVKEVKPTVVSLSSCKASLSYSKCIYDGSARKPSVTVKNGSKTLKSGTDYTVSYKNNKNVGTATVTVTGKGDYTGTIKKSFTINKKSVSKLSASLSYRKCMYDGSERKPSVTVKNGSKTLKSGTDYTVSYKNNKNVGKAAVTITGKGNYTGTIKKSFTINKKSVSKLTVSLSYRKCIYNGSERKPSVTVKNGSKTLKSGTDYTVSYKNNKNIGKAAVTITGKGNYSGTRTKTFAINPKAISLSKAYNVSGKKLKATWKKASGVTGYQLQYSTSSKFTNAKTKTVSGTTKTLTGLSKNKTYYVRVRDYKTVSKTNYYSAWSASKKVKIQK